LHERVARLKRLRRLSFQEYIADDLRRDAVERNFQVAVECCADIAGQVLAELRLPRPDRRREVFQVLAQAGLLSQELANVMSNLVSLRNRLVHVYLTIEPDKMYQHLQEDIRYFEAFEAVALGWLEEREQETGKRE